VGRLGFLRLNPIRTDQLGLKPFRRNELGGRALGRRSKLLGPCLLGLMLLVQACSLPWGIRRQPSPRDGFGLGAQSRQDPALSGDGRLLASLVLRSGRSTVVLQDRRSGQVLPLPQLGGQQPHSSPSLSWNGRYLALLVWRGGRRQVVINDRATHRLLPLPLGGDRDPQRVSLAADARHLAVEVVDGGQSRVEVFDLGDWLEPDPVPGQLQQGPAAGWRP